MIWLSVAAFIGLFASSSHAQLIATESFNYTPSYTPPTTGTPSPPPDTLIVGSTTPYYPPKGNDAGWPNTGQKWSTTVSNNTSFVETADLSYGNLTKSGNMLHTNAGGQGVYRTFGQTYGTVENSVAKDYWFSAIMEVDSAASSSYAGISLFQGTSEKFFFGQDMTAKFWSMELSAITLRAQSTIPSTSLVSAFVVLELNGASKTANLYVNPSTLGGNAPATPSATLSFSNHDFSFDRIRIQSGGLENLDADEFRFGTTYADVTPTTVPEPTTYLLMAIALGAVAICRRLMKIS
jgi:hypothetical protein